MTISTSSKIRFATTARMAAIWMTCLLTVGVLNCSKKSFVSQQESTAQPVTSNAPTLGSSLSESDRIKQETEANIRDIKKMIARMNKQADEISSRLDTSAS